MQKLLRYIIPLVLAITACTKDFTETNTDPNQFGKSTPEALLAGAVKRTGDMMGMANTNYHWTYSHLITMTAGSSRYGVGEDGFWETAYVELLGNLNQVRIQFAEKEGFSNRVQIARIWEQFVYATLVGTYGPIPMKNALKPNQGPTILFDTEDEVYTAILDNLKEAAAQIDPAKDKLVYDVLYNGDLLKWKHFANTLRLRIALRCRRNLQTIADKHISEIMQDPASTLSAENETAKVAYENIDGNQNPYYTKFIRNYYPVDIMPKMSDLLFTYFRSYKDPRMAIYFDSIPAVNKRFQLTDTLTSTHDDSLRIVTYPIPYFGIPKSPFLLPAWGLSGDPIGGLNINAYSDPRRNTFYAPDRPFIFLSFAESAFLKAEAALLGFGGPAAALQYYNTGIEANFAYWNVPATAAAAYKARPGILWDTEGKGFRTYLNITSTDIPADNLHKIWIQRWINYFPDGGFDAWCLERQTRFLDLPPLTNPANQYIAEIYADLPNRWIYPSTVVTYNAAGYADAVSKLGGDEHSPYTNLRFLQPLQRKDWNTAPAAFNFSFIQKWFGNNVEDLNAKGVPYKIVRAYK